MKPRHRMARYGLGWLTTPRGRTDAASVLRFEAANHQRLRAAVDVHAIAAQGLGVQQTAGIFVNLHSCLQEFPVITATGGGHETGVVASWEYDAGIDAPIEAQG